MTGHNLTPMEALESAVRSIAEVFAQATTMNQVEETKQVVSDTIKHYSKPASTQLALAIQIAFRINEQSPQPLANLVGLFESAVERIAQVRISQLRREMLH